MQRGTHKEVENKMKLRKVIMNFVMLLTITLIGTASMGCNVKAASVSSVYSALKKEPGLKDAKQWMVINEKEHGYLVLSSQTSAKNFRDDKESIVDAITGGSDVSISSDYNMCHVKDKDGAIHVKAVNVDPRDSDNALAEFLFEQSKIDSIANSVQIYNSLKEVSKVIE